MHSLYTCVAVKYGRDLRLFENRKISTPNTVTKMGKIYGARFENLFWVAVISWIDTCFTFNNMNHGSKVGASFLHHLIYT